MKCTVLIENETNRSDLIAEHGLSLYIETENLKILFDSGQSDTFYKNACVLGIDLSQVDYFILSHGHYDHGGGIQKFLEINSHAPVFVHKHAFHEYMHGFDKYIGLNQNLKNHSRLIFIDDIFDFDNGFQLIPLSKCKLKYPVQSFGLYEKVENEWIEDCFSHEIILQCITPNHKVLFSGCTHSGIINIMELFHPDILVGGFHLKKQEDKDCLYQLANQLNTYDAVYYTGHCTGKLQYTLLKSVMKDKLHSFCTGTILTFMEE